MENVAELTHLRFSLNIKGPEINSFAYFFSQLLAVFRQRKLG